MNTFYCWITLVEAVEAEDEDDAFDRMMELIADRGGMEISSHSIIEGED